MGVSFLARQGDGRSDRYLMGVFDAFWVATTLRSSTPLILGATGELAAERTGILNIGLEGMMLVGAFFGFLGAWLTGETILAVAFGMAAGIAMASLMAVLAIQARADQIVVGIGLNILALGITSFLFRKIFEGPQVLLNRPVRFSMPALSTVPFLGEALFNQPVLVYLALGMVPAMWLLLYRTTWGLSMRAAGELPEAVDAAGADTLRVRWAGTLLAGALAGMGGAFLSTELGIYVEGMTAGRGFLALAAVIFGRWRPVGVLAACLVFGGADALQLRLQSHPFVPPEVWLLFALAGATYAVVAARRALFRVRLGGVLVGLFGLVLFLWEPRLVLPSQLWRAVPYLLTLAVLAGVVGAARMPTALAVPYRRGGSA